MLVVLVFLAAIWRVTYRRSHRPEIKSAPSTALAAHADPSLEKSPRSAPFVESLHTAIAAKTSSRVVAAMENSPGSGPSLGSSDSQVETLGDSRLRRHLVILYE